MSSSTSVSPCRRFTFAEIQFATKDFNDILCIGEGGFGKVYKGEIISEGQGLFVAIKRLDSMSSQGGSEFRVEIEMLSNLRHCHLVSLIGYCDENKEMILVYEYMRHGTLYHHLHKAETPLNWMQRIKIAIGAGRGLDYLHTGIGTHHGIIHRDVKTSNILLDENFGALISDFGLSRIGPTNQSISFVDATVKGTFGYLDPEYFYTTRLTRKTDVYAFGVVLFELLSGRLPVDIRYGEDECSLVRWAQKCQRERKLDQMVDSNIKGTIFPKCLRGFAQIAGNCLNSVPKERPTMTEVVASLEALLKLQCDTSSPKIFENNVEAGDLIYFTYCEMTCVTSDFGDHVFLSKDRYGDLYKGWINTLTYSQCKDDTNFPVLVKKLYRYKHFDLDMLKKHRHPNLVKLIGYCLEGKKLLLVYEFMHNRNLDELLRSGAIAQLSLSTKVKIAIGIARGIVFLNNTEYVSESQLYRHKIMLDEDFTAKLSDYDVIKLVEGHSTRANDGKDLGYYYPGCEPFLLQSKETTLLLQTNLSGFEVVFAEILIGKRIFCEKSYWLDRKIPYRDFAIECFTSCNEMDSESRMLKTLKDNEKVIEDPWFLDRINKLHDNPPMYRQTELELTILKKEFDKLIQKI